MYFKFLCINYRCHQTLLLNYFLNNIEKQVSEITSSPLARLYSKELSQKYNIKTAYLKYSTKIKIATYPNIISLSRILATPFLCKSILNEQYILATSLFAVLSISDFIDGYIARTFASQKSIIGSLLDPLADKLMIGVATITLSLNHLIPLQLTVLILIRDVLLIIGSLYLRFVSLAQPVSFTNFFNPLIKSVQILPSLVSRVNTVLQLTVIGTAMINPLIYVPYQCIVYPVIWTITGVTTMLSLLDYFYFRSGFKMLKRKK